MRKQILLTFSLVAVLYACAPVISKQSLREVDPAITFQELVKDPEKYSGKVILLGGRILATAFMEGETWVEVLQQPLDWQQKPEDTDVSYGRFLIRFAEFRDPVIYAAGRRITVLGEVQGKRVLPLREMDYTYPVLLPREHHLWEPETGFGPSFHIGIGIGGVIR
jgi:outer membrane lipoprotein